MTKKSVFTIAAFGGVLPWMTALFLFTTLQIRAADTDSDSMDDGWETTWFGSLARNGFGDYDSDGVSDLGEFLEGTIPLSPDTDSDGLPDNEIYIFYTSPLNPDTDGDGMNDKWEITYFPMSYANDPANPSPTGDPDADYASNYSEAQAGSSPFDEDTENDGVLDWIEITYSMNPLSSDTDGDMLDDASEYFSGLNPSSSDSDNDGINDYDELNVWSSYPTAADSDSDYLPDGWELMWFGHPLSTATSSSDEDNDGSNNSVEFNNSTDPTDPNSH